MTDDEKGDTVNTRTVETATETVVRHVAKPTGRKRENGPHLDDLRKFVKTCEGLPDDLQVHIVFGYLSEGGRRDVTFTVRHRIVHDTESSEDTA